MDQCLVCWYCKHSYSLLAHIRWLAYTNRHQASSRNEFPWYLILADAHNNPHGAVKFALEISKGSETRYRVFSTSMRTCSIAFNVCYLCQNQHWSNCGLLFPSHNILAEYHVYFQQTSTLLISQGQMPPKTLGILTNVCCTSGPNLVILAWSGEELSCGQAHNGLNLEFEVKFDLDFQGQSPPKTIGIFTKIFYTYGLWSKFRDPSLNRWWVTARTSTWLSHTHTGGRTRRQTQATTIPDGHNWPWVKNARDLNNSQTLPWRAPIIAHFYNFRHCWFPYNIYDAFVYSGVAPCPMIHICLIYTPFVSLLVYKTQSECTQYIYFFSSSVIIQNHASLQPCFDE